MELKSKCAIIWLIERRRLAKIKKEKKNYFHCLSDPESYACLSKLSFADHRKLQLH